MRLWGHVGPALALAVGLAPACALDTEVWDPIADTPPADADGLTLEWPADTPLPAGFAAPPWLTMPAPGRISVGWLTDNELAARVELIQIAGPAGAPPPVPHEASFEAPAARVHHVDLGELPPASGFRYRVELAGGAAREGVFVTPGQLAWRFVHIAEFHAPTHSDDVARFASAIRSFRPHVVVESGDMLDDGDQAEDWIDYLRTSSPWISNVILLPAHSNHVNGLLGNAYLKSYFELPGNERWYATRYGAVEFVTLDSTYNGPSPDMDEQLAWIRGRAPAVPPPELVIGAWHYPACSSSYAGRSESRRWVIDNFLPALLDAGRVDLLLVGHDKYYERSVLAVGGRAIPHVMTNIGKIAPSTEGGNEPECTALVTDTETRSILIAAVEPGRLHARVLDDEGGVLDDFEVTGDEP